MPFSSTECPSCSNSLWEHYGASDGHVKCTNCGLERGYHDRSPNPDAGYTESQKSRLEQIKRWFREWTTTDPDEVYEWEEHYNEYGDGDIRLYIRTDEHPLVQETYHLKISRRGRVYAFSSTSNRILDSLYSSKDSRRRAV